MEEIRRPASLGRRRPAGALLTMIALFVGFAALSLAFWAYFRNKPINS